MTRVFLQNAHPTEGRQVRGLFIGVLRATTSHSHISQARGHIVRILYVFAQFPMNFRRPGQLFAWLDQTEGRKTDSTARLPFYRSEDIGFINVIG